MGFTFWAVGAPLLLMFTGYLFGWESSMHGLAGWFWVIGVPWFWIGLPCAVLYWLVRLARFAWRDGAAAELQPAGRELSEIETGRIFGRLN